MKFGTESKIDALTNVLGEETSRREARRNGQIRPWIWSILASLGIFGGISSLFVGLVFVAIHGLLSTDTIFDRVGTGLLIVAIPMILIGSICVDKIEDKK